jgi:hypothetical protein
MEAQKIESDARIATLEKEAEIERRRVEAQVSAFREQMGALHPELVATLKMLGSQHLAAELSKNVSPLAILGGESVVAVVEKLIGSLPIGTAPDGDVKKVLGLSGKARG